MQFEIGDTSPKNGELLLAGDFEPTLDDLTNVRYKNSYGKHEYKSARDTIENKTIVIEKELIDTEKFFRLKFNLAGIGDQSRALYDTNNAIIDGAAGTGKSTIALQKLKYFHLKECVKQNEMAVIVKNPEVKLYFETLLNDPELNLKDIEIFTVQYLLESLHIDATISEEEIKHCFKLATLIRKTIVDRINGLSLENLEKHFLRLLEDIGKVRLIEDLNALLVKVENDIDNKNKIQQLNIELQKINEKLFEDNLEDEQKLELLEKFKKLNNKKKQLTGEIFKKSIELIEATPEKISTEILKQLANHNYDVKDSTKFNVLYWIKKYINFYNDKDRSQTQLESNKSTLQELETEDIYQTKIESLKEKISLKQLELTYSQDSKTIKDTLKKLLEEEKSILKNIQQLKLLPKKIEELSQKLSIPFKVTRQEKKSYVSVMNEIYFKESYLVNTYIGGHSEKERYLLKQYLLEKEKYFNTLIIDEAQDYTIAELELLRLQTKRIILAGDILQNIQANDINGWNDIFNYEKVFGTENEEGKIDINIFNLKHNFRQTYQLANASYNFRQLLLNAPLEDIEKEYYKSEKEFNGIPYSRPLLQSLFSNRQFIEHLKKKVVHIEKTYSSKIPIALIYQTHQERDNYLTLFSFLKVSTQISKREDVDIVLINLLEAKGKEFPIVMCNIDRLTDREIYLIMTRAQFEIDLITFKEKLNNQNIEQLIEYQWIQMDGSKEETANNSHESDQYTLVDETESSEALEPITDIATKAESQLPDDENIEDNNKETMSVKDTLTKINDHVGDTHQIKEPLNPDTIFDEKKYIESFKEEMSKAQTITNKKKVVIIKKEIDVDVSRQHNEIKEFLYQNYKGYCQSCGFSFRKVKDGKNSFEKFSWDDKRIVKVPKGVITSAESVCLCRNCAANIKFGAFEPSFTQKILEMEDFNAMDIDEIISILNIGDHVNSPEIFEDHLFFNDILALKIKLNQQERSLFFTREHLVQFIIYLQLENKMLNFKKKH